MRTLKIHSLGKFQVYSIFNYNQHGVHWISRTYSSYNGKFVPFGQHLISPQFLATTHLLSGSLSLAFLDSTYKGDHMGVVEAQASGSLQLRLLPSWAQPMGKGLAALVEKPISGPENSFWKIPEQLNL